MAELKVPLALNSENHLKTPQEAKKGNKYFCPSCKSKVILRKGDKVVHHFAHKASNVCTAETIIHKTAKKLIQQSIDNWKSGTEKAPKIIRKCKYCDYQTYQDIPDKITHTKQEIKLNSGHVADVLLYKKKKHALAVEIRVSHAVSEEKSKSISLPFIELLGQDVIENPNIWKPVQGHLKTLNCPECAKKIKWFKKRLQEVSHKINIPVPKEYYRTSFANCWRCGKEMLIFSWPSAQSQPSKRPEVEPIPKTLKYRYSKTVCGKYWANICPSCMAIQGNFFLYNEPDEPFFGLHTYEQDSHSYKQGMRDLARYAYYLAHEY